MFKKWEWLIDCDYEMFSSLFQKFIKIIKFINYFDFSFASSFCHPEKAFRIFISNRSRAGRKQGQHDSCSMINLNLKISPWHWNQFLNWHWWNSVGLYWLEQSWQQLLCFHRCQVQHHQMIHPIHHQRHSLRLLNYSKIEFIILI